VVHEVRSIVPSVQETLMGLRCQNRSEANAGYRTTVPRKKERTLRCVYIAGSCGRAAEARLRTWQTLDRGDRYVSTDSNQRNEPPGWTDDACRFRPPGNPEALSLLARPAPFALGAVRNTVSLSS